MLIKQPQRPMLTRGGRVRGVPQHKREQQTRPAACYLHPLKSCSLALAQSGQPCRIPAAMGKFVLLAVLLATTLCSGALGAHNTVGQPSAGVRSRWGGMLHVHPHLRASWA